MRVRASVSSTRVVVRFLYLYNHYGGRAAHNSGRLGPSPFIDVDDLLLSLTQRQALYYSKKQQYQVWWVFEARAPRGTPCMSGVCTLGRMNYVRVFGLFSRTTLALPHGLNGPNDVAFSRTTCYLEHARHETYTHGNMFA